MLLRRIDTGWLAVTQPAHARLAGQLAAAWGADWVAPVEPREWVVAGAILHDIGWLDWESAPTLNPDTGLPYTFLELPIAVHIGMWRRASTLALAFGRYPALLTSLHGTRLYGGRDVTKLDRADAVLITAFLEEERDRQAGWIATLASDPTTVDTCTDAVLARNSRYIALWDAMSLSICGGVREERSFQAPARDGDSRTIRLWPEPDAQTVAIDPWPFGATDLVVTADARHLDRRFSDEQEMGSVLASADWHVLTVRLVHA